jgi:hypothetical protein
MTVSVPSAPIGPEVPLTVVQASPVSAHLNRHRMWRPVMFLAATSLVLVACGGSSNKQSTGTSSATTAPATTTTTAPATTTTTVPVSAQSSYLAGNAHPQYPAGTPDEMSVVYQAPIASDENGTSVPFVFRNHTKAAVSHVDISATATDTAGKIVASGSSQGTAPAVVEPNQWAYAYIYFSPGTALATADKLSFSFETSPANTQSYNTAPIQVTQANLSGTAIAGGVQNTTGQKVEGPISISAYCLNSAGKPTRVHSTFTTGSGDLAPASKDSFQVDLYGQSCPSFLVGASGWYAP